MIAGSNGDRSGDTRPLWITGLSPPDSWRSLRQPGYLQLDQVRHPKHRVWGYDRTLKVRNFRSTNGVRPYVRTGSLGGLDRMPGMLILELYRAQISERGVETS